MSIEEIPEPVHEWSEVTADLIFDLGMHDGTDTAYYLHRGFRVVGVEAHPALCVGARHRFAAELESGQLVIENVAIAENTEVTFFASSSDQWGTVLPEWVARNEALGKRVVGTMTVPGADVLDLIRKYGVPHYIKVDIEGADLLVLRSLARTDARPHYLSIESTMKSWADLVSEIDLLERMGYDSFKAVAQHSIGKARNARDLAGYEFPSSGSSGPFGERTWGPWRDRRDILRDYRRIFRRYRLLDVNARPATLPRRLLVSALTQVFGEAGWWDTHARHRSARPDRKPDA